MRLGQIKWNGATTAAIFNHVSARPIPDYTLCDLICRGEKENRPLSVLAEELAIPRPIPAEPLIPLQPREVWGCDSTYQAFTQAGNGDRPHIFFKGTARVCVGPGQSIGIRSDSRFTAPEPELAVVLGARGRILGYTLANDVSAQDLARESPHYHSQAKTFQGSCALGPIMVTADEIDDPRDLVVSCSVMRNGEMIFSGEVSTGQLGRSVEALVGFLMHANPVPAGSVLLMGTGIVIGEEAALEAGDSVTIRVDKIGELTNQAAVVGLAQAAHSS